jgi:hypothetical protein
MKIDIAPSRPVVVYAGDSWELQWDRSPEARALADFFNDASYYPQVLCLLYSDMASYREIIARFSENSTAPVISLGHREMSAGPMLVAIASRFIADTGKWPAYISQYILGMRGARVSALRDEELKLKHPRMVEMLSSIEKILREDRDVLPYMVAEMIGLDKSVVEEQKALHQDKRFSDFFSSSAAERAFLEDLSSSEELREFVESPIFALTSSSSQALISLKKLQPFGVKAAVFRRGGFPSSAIDDLGDMPNIEVGTISIEEADELLLPIISKRSGKDNLRSFLKLLLNEKASVIRPDNAISSTRRISQGDLISTIDGISIALSGDEDEPFQQKMSVVRAEVVDERLVVIDKDASSKTPIEHLEAYRSEYLKEARQLRATLSGVNAGPGFTRRLEAIEDSLSSEFTEVSSLILADQTRGLEIMLPAVCDTVVDTTAKDISAFVTGLGLLSRQFPAWQQFVEEANQNQPLDQQNEECLTEIALILQNQSDEVISPEIKDAIAQTQAARIDSSDTILDFAFTRAIGNAYRAVGKYLLDRAKGIAAQFNSSLEKGFGEVMAKSVLAGSVGLASHALIQLAGGLPLEFAWFASLAVLLAPTKK